MNESKKISSKNSQANSSNTLLEQLYKKIGMDKHINFICNVLGNSKLIAIMLLGISN